MVGVRPGGVFAALCPADMDHIAYIGMVNSGDIAHIDIMKAESLFPAKKLIALSNEMAAEISAYRFEQRIGSEAEAIRRLIAAGLAASSVKQQAGGPKR